MGRAYPTIDYYKASEPILYLHISLQKTNTLLHSGCCSLKRAVDHRSYLKAEVPGGAEIVWANDGVLGLES